MDLDNAKPFSKSAAATSQCDFGTAAISLCSGLLVCLPPGSLLPLSVSQQGQLRRLHPSRTCVVAFARIGYAIGRLQAINRTGTLTQLDSQFCRLLPIPAAPTNHPICSQ